ncbi:hypothetical protein C8P68_105398 [Mucilaginibacter yixingensis]|uniref:HAMP domain-containing protein n=1 Tax=Mucilaginibacter yixingensis TaxID=1295612 RepID=A0A2T5J8V3_9SPHI|nr:hypothetical protein [Mucilaginibacter yixingensis]PTQ95887.1 hypothetical protein C8P68_105398 [Mucilaginibacter yixingensis]
MKIYHFMSRLRFTDRKYAFKLMLTAFIGTHIPLIGLIVYLLADTGDTMSRSTCLLLILGLTLAGTAVTLWVLYGLVRPLKMAQRSLSKFLQHNTMPHLPEGYQDEIGILMRHINFIAAHMHTPDFETQQKIRANTAQIELLVNVINQKNTSPELAVYINDLQVSVNNQLEFTNGPVVKNA